MPTLLHALGWIILVWIIALAVVSFELARAPEGSDHAK
jgi:hypothetical protein